MYYISIKLLLFKQLSSPPHDEPSESTGEIKPSISSTHTCLPSFHHDQSISPPKAPSVQRLPSQQPLQGPGLMMNKPVMGAFNGTWTSQATAITKPRAGLLPGSCHVTRRLLNWNVVLIGTVFSTCASSTHCSRRPFQL